MSARYPGMKIGYARVSTDEQNLSLQLHALEKVPCDIILTDKASGADASRKGLRRALRRIKAGDILVVWKLDRLGRSLMDLVKIVEHLNQKRAGLRILTGQGSMIDTTHSEGRLMFSLFAALAEFERELIRERTIAGMKAARRRGVHIGRPRKLSPAQLHTARRWIERRAKTYKQAADSLDVSVTTLRRGLDSFSG
ncbi:recombinase family protein [Nitratireductor aquibiodomus]|uniref:recombinase family protein n=1 Tax=Nitratireductor aquibiodomus TaxID=204799 RepID=UPI000ACFB4A9|nr:recombinase family protein [Nitratireductor aquibiodomus]